MTGACIDPGPDSLKANSAGTNTESAKRSTQAIGRTAPERAEVSWDLPSEKPLFPSRFWSIIFIMRKCANREKMLETQALDERDLLVKKIGDKIAKASFVDTVRPNEEKVYAKRIDRIRRFIWIT